MKTQSAIDLCLYLAAMVVFVLTGFSCCHGAEPLDLAILLPRPVSAQPCEPLDLSLLAPPVERTSMRVEALDLSILSDVPAAKPAVKPSPKTYVTPELGKEKGDAPRPMAKVIDYQYPLRSNHWTHPSTIRQHVASGQHAGKLTAEEIMKMTDAELEAWHSDDHEGKAHHPAKIEKMVAAATTTKPAKPTKVARKTVVQLGITYYEHADGIYRATKEPGSCYCGAGCKCDDCDGNCPAQVTKPSQVTAPRPVYQQSGCPGGNCPTNRGGILFWRKG